ncbi:MAG: hypothetical protein ACRBBN_07745 [Methyloligellaceae bacterium]
METSIFLAKLIGPVLFVLGLLITLNPAAVKRIAQEFIESEALIFLSGILTLPTGIAIALTHNIWEPDWRLIITIFGWLCILAGVARLTLTRTLKNIGQIMLQKTPMIFIPGVLFVILGGYLSCVGYFS